MRCYKHEECGADGYFWAFLQNVIMPLCWGHGKTIEAMGGRIRQMKRRK